MNKENQTYIPDPTLEEGFDGLYIGDSNNPVDYEPKPIDFDLHRLAKYVREHNINNITDDIKEMFK